MLMKYKTAIDDLLAAKDFLRWDTPNKRTTALFPGDLSGQEQKRAKRLC